MGWDAEMWFANVFRSDLADFDKFIQSIKGYWWISLENNEAS